MTLIGLVMIAIGFFMFVFSTQTPWDNELLCW
jgi:hypothetical protein